MAGKKKVDVNKIKQRAYVGQLAVIVIGESRAFAGEVVEVDPETGQILAAYITGGRMLRFTLGHSPTCALLPRDWTDKATVFSLCPRDGWESLMRARDLLQPLYREWLENEKEKAQVGLTNKQRREWLAKYSVPRSAK